MDVNQINNTVDKYFKHREIEYSPKVKVGDSIVVWPDTIVFSDNMFEDAALGVTRIFILLDKECPINGIYPSDAFYMKRPDGSILYGTKWESGVTTYG